MKKETGSAEEAERLLEQGEKAFKDHEQMLRMVNKEMTKKVEKLEKERDRLANENLNLKAEKIDTLKQHSSEVEELMAESRTSAAIAVLQARMEMAGEDPSNWTWQAGRMPLAVLWVQKPRGALTRRFLRRLKKVRAS